MFYQNIWDNLYHFVKRSMDFIYPSYKSVSTPISLIIYLFHILPHTHTHTHLTASSLFRFFHHPSLITMLLIVFIIITSTQLSFPSSTQLSLWLLSYPASTGQPVNLNIIPGVASHRCHTEQIRSNKRVNHRRR